MSFRPSLCYRYADHAADCPVRNPVHVFAGGVRARGLWYVAPRLARLPREVALVPLVWVHVFRIAGGTILAPGAVGDAVPMAFRTMIGYGDMLTALLAMVALIALRLRSRYAIALVWLFVVVGLIDTVNAIIESMRYSVFNYPLGVNWVIVTSYVPALLVSTVLIFIHLRRPRLSPG
jgi:hypothetical protein